MAAGQVIAQPKDLLRGGVQAGGPIAAEMDIDAAMFNDRGRGGVGIDIIAQRFRGLAVEDLLVAESFSGGGIDADDKEVMAIGSGGGEPDLAIHYDWSGPAAIRDFSLPLDVIGFAPMKGKTGGVGGACGGDVAIARRPAEFGPVRARDSRSSNRED